MKLYNTPYGIVLDNDGRFFLMNDSWDELVNRDNLQAYLADQSNVVDQLDKDEAKMILGSLLPPIGRQEVWAAGVTYLKSRDARMEESQNSGAASLYDR